MMPSLLRGLETSGRTLADFALCAQVIVVTGRNEAEHQSALAMARNQIAFYASTPAYRSVLETEGRPELQPELRQMTKEGRWHEMANKIDDDLLDKIAVVGTPGEVAEVLRHRYGTLASRLGFASPFPIAPECAADIIGALRADSSEA
jgi:alkanesulfonate monooxygenase SsuD/methylene tetrahydromethanopterin reductase-like flavin-dependent oxidoreductase (luciferase family)